MKSAQKVHVYNKIMEYKIYLKSLSKLFGDKHTSMKSTRTFDTTTDKYELYEYGTLL